MRDINISLENIVYLATALTALVVAYTHVSKPFKIQIKRIDVQDEYLINDFKRINELNNKFDESRKNNYDKDVIILKSLQAIMRNQLSEHENKRQLEKVSEELDEYLLNK